MKVPTVKENFGKDNWSMASAGTVVTITPLAFGFSFLHTQHGWLFITHTDRAWKIKIFLGECFEWCMTGLRMIIC